MIRYGTVDRDYGMRLATCDPSADGPIYMLNLMKYRSQADYGTGAGPDVTGREADDLYAPTDVFAVIGASVVFMAEVLDASEDWNRVAVARYPTRRAFIEMQSRKDFQKKHVHKEAGMDHTIVMGTVPVADLPARAKPNRVVLEVWKGDAPSMHGTAFTVQGTIVGDGRSWDGATFRAAEDDVDVTNSSNTHQLLVLQPVVDRWH